METTTLVTGGTGTLGSLVVPRLRDAGHTVRVLSRSSREAAESTELVTGDLATGEGIGAAVDGAEVVVHLAGSAKGDEVKAENLVRAASRAGTVRHLVHISVVGADRVPVVSGVVRTMVGYFASTRWGGALVWCRRRRRRTCRMSTCPTRSPCRRSIRRPSAR